MEGRQEGEEVGGWAGREDQADFAGEMGVKGGERVVGGGGVGEGEGHDFGFAEEESTTKLEPLSG